MAAVLVVGCVRQSSDNIATIPPRGNAPVAAVSSQSVAANVAAIPAATSLLPAPEAPSDTVITGKIKASLVTDPEMSGADVSVNTDRGVVILTGLVASQEQAALASAHAQRLDGVMRVDNHLAVNLR